MSNEHDRPTVDAALVRHVASLAKLELTDEEVARMVPQLDAILGHVDQLRAIELDAEHTADAGHIDNAVALDDLRRDEPFTTSDETRELARQMLMRQAPASDGAFFVVPKVLDHASDTDRERNGDA